MVSIRPGSESFIQKVQAEASHFEGKTKYIKAIWNHTVGKQFNALHIAHQNEVAGRTDQVAQVLTSPPSPETPPPERSESPIRALTEGTAPTDPKALEVSKQALLTEVNAELAPIYQKLENGKDLTDQEMAIALKALDVKAQAAKAKTGEEISKLSKELKNPEKSVITAHIMFDDLSNKPNCISLKAWKEMFTVDISSPTAFARVKCQHLLKLLYTISKLPERERNREPWPGTETPGPNESTEVALQKKFEAMLPQK